MKPEEILRRIETGKRIKSADLLDKIPLESQDTELENKIRKIVRQELKKSKR